MRIFGLVALAALGLSACSSGDGEKGGAAAEMVKREAGSWKNSITLDEFDVPGAPPEMKGMMQGMMSSAAAQEVCLTEEQAKKEDIAEELAKSQQAKQCEFTKRNVGGSAIDVAATCKGDGGDPMMMTMTGTAGATSTKVKMTMKGKGPTGGAMSMGLTMASTRTGPCKKGQKTMDGGTFS